MTIEEHKKAIIENLNAMVDKLDDDTEYFDALYHLDMLCKETDPCEDCISREDALLCLTGRDLPENRNEYIGIVNERLKGLPSVQPISKSVIEDIKADIADFMAKIPALGNCKEGWHNAGQRIGLEQACEIIDKHIAEMEDKE